MQLNTLTRLIAVISLGLVAGGCPSEEIDELRERLSAAEAREEALRVDVEALAKAVEPLLEAYRAAEEAKLAETQEKSVAEERWRAVQGSYRCTGGGIVTGVTVRNGYMQFQASGLEHLIGNQSYPARRRGDTIYITDQQRGTVGWRIAEGGKVLIPSSPIYAKRCTKK